MKASEYIEELQKLIDEHGDLEVDTYNGMGRSEATAPQIRYRKILNSRESKPGFYYDYMDASKKGEKVIWI